MRNKPNEPTSSFIRAKLLKIDLWVISLAFANYRFFYDATLPTDFYRGCKISKFQSPDQDENFFSRWRFHRDASKTCEEIKLFYDFKILQFFMNLKKKKKHHFPFHNFIF